MFRPRSPIRLGLTFFFLLSAAVPLRAQSNPAVRYDMGHPVLRDLWVDGINGDDGNSGADRAHALKTPGAAWRLVPTGNLAETGYQIMLAGGIYPRSALPVYMEERHGTFEHPVVIRAADGPGTVTLQGDLNVAHCDYLYLLDFTVSPGTDTVHLEACDHVLLCGLRLDGGTFVPDGENAGVAYDNLKVNQSQYVYVEDCEVSGATDNTVDFVAVQYGHLLHNRIHNANDWALYLKGGSAYFLVDGNEVWDAGTGGISMGQGTGFQFMTPPWLHYETYDMKVTNNVVHDTEGAGLGVNGGYNVLLAYNTLYRVGARSHVLEVVFGGRTCDGVPGDPGRERCAEYLAAGGWGTTAGDGSGIYIPDRNVYVYNNLIYNPAPYQSQWQHLAVYGPITWDTQLPSNAPFPTRTDDNLRIRGNLIWNGPGDFSLGLGEESGCRADNPTCSPEEIAADNSINSQEPRLKDPAHGKFAPTPGVAPSLPAPVPIPDFTGEGRPERPVTPVGNLSNAVTLDRDGRPRAATNAVGAHVPALPSEGGDGLMGDSTLDGAVDVSDAVETLRYIAGLAAFTPQQLRNADLDGDTVIDVSDVVALLKGLVGRINSSLSADRARIWMTPVWNKRMVSLSH